MLASLDLGDLLPHVSVAMWMVLVLLMVWVAFGGRKYLCLATIIIVVIIVAVVVVIWRGEVVATLLMVAIIIIIIVGVLLTTIAPGIVVIIVDVALPCLFKRLLVSRILLLLLRLERAATPAC